MATVLGASAADWFVTTNGTGYGSGWEDPTNSIQGAIDASDPSSSSPVTIWVSNGVYEAIPPPAGTFLHIW